MEFVREIINQKLRLQRLRMECDYFTIDAIAKDVNFILNQGCVSFSTNDRVTIAAECTRSRQNDEITGWTWGSLSGNSNLLSKTGGNGSSFRPSTHMAQVHSTGMYIVLYSLYSAAHDALFPDEGYKSERDDEFCTFSVRRDAMTRSDRSDETITLLRCGAFHYRETNNPMLFVTATAADLILLREGYDVYCGHGRLTTGGEVFIRDTVNRHQPHIANSMTFIKVPGSNVAKFHAFMEDDRDEQTFVTWKRCNIATRDQSVTNKLSQIACVDTNDDTKIRFNKSGYYILVGLPPV